jgi:hypothetical protein
MEHRERCVIARDKRISISSRSALSLPLGALLALSEGFILHYLRKLSSVLPRAMPSKTVLTLLRIYSHLFSAFRPGTRLKS